jgi:hypothetical protein
LNFSSHNPDGRAIIEGLCHYCFSPAIGTPR